MLLAIENLKKKCRETKDFKMQLGNWMKVKLKYFLRFRVFIRVSHPTCEAFLSLAILYERNKNCLLLITFKQLELAI